jgi:Golgi nucleoside diphosphatase
MANERHPVEAKASWDAFLEHQIQQVKETTNVNVDAEPYEQHRYLRDADDIVEAQMHEPHHSSLRPGRSLKHHKSDMEYHKDADNLVKFERAKEEAYLLEVEKSVAHNKHKAEKAHEKRMKQLYANSGIQRDSVHGMMIDAGSTGSRIHIFEWDPRVLVSHHDVEDAVAGKRLSFPNSLSRWSDRLRPGIASFASIKDEDKLHKAVEKYMEPLLEFAKMVLREKVDQFDSFPIFFRATAGMRTLDKDGRFRVLNAVRNLFHNNTHCPFYFEDEFARVLSGEEEAVFGWAGTNFIMGNLLQESQGAGTVVNPRLTFGALDMGGASTQISFYEPHEDIMAGLFKLQIGQGKHWNIYAHSFLYFGMNEARGRFQASLLAGFNDTTRLLTGVDNPCLPGGTQQEVRINVHIDHEGHETWDPESGVAEDGFYQGLLKNDHETGDFDGCMKMTKELLHLEDNKWCNFAHQGDCSFNGVSMPELPRQSEHFGEFLAISNYYHVWEFLGLPKKASLEQLYNSTEKICSMSESQILKFNQENAKVDESDVNDYCFRSSYVFNMLRHGYGFELDEHITATDVINGQKVGWALGAMLYEINTMPWAYERPHQESLSSYDHSDSRESYRIQQGIESIFTSLVILVTIGAIFVVVKAQRRQKNRDEYLPLK